MLKTSDEVVRPGPHPSWKGGVHPIFPGVPCSLLWGNVGSSEFLQT